MSKVGVIQEQGDYGLGFDALKEDESKTVKDYMKEFKIQQKMENDSYRSKSYDKIKDKKK